MELVVESCAFCVESFDSCVDGSLCACICLCQCFGEPVHDGWCEDEVAQGSGELVGKAFLPGVGLAAVAPFAGAVVVHVLLLFEFGDELVPAVAAGTTPLNGKFSLKVFVWCGVRCACQGCVGRNPKFRHDRFVGLYAVTSLRLGLYDVDVSAAGFKNFVRKDLELRVARKATLDFTLELGSVQESVTVQGGNKTLKTWTAQLGAVVSPEKMVELPLNARNFTQVITLTPGAGHRADQRVRGDRGGLQDGLPEASISDVLHAD